MSTAFAAAPPPPMPEPVAFATPPAAQPNAQPNAQPVAHWTHTLALLTVLTLTTFYGHSTVAAAAPVETARAPHYLTTIVIEWLLLGSVIAGIYRRGTFLQQAVQQRGRGAWEVFGMGLASYCLGFMALGVVGAALYFTPLAHERNTALILAMLPHTFLQFVLWFGISATAGICEELIFRGYLIQQVSAWTRRPVLAIVLCGLLFGGVHLYEGLGAILPLAALGIVYGFIARYSRGDLRPVMIAHTLQDFLVAFLVFAKPVLDKYQPVH